MGVTDHPELVGPFATEQPAELAEFGYVEEEWFVTGVADAFDPQGIRLGTGEPYTTRFLVRRPADAARASGTAFVDPLHMIGEMPASWFAAEWFAREGHAWVGVTVHNSSFATRPGFAGGVDSLRERDADRYAPLHLAEFDAAAPPRSYTGPSGVDSVALRWNMAMAHPQGHPILVDVGRLLRNDPAFAALGLRRLYGCGTSQTANLWRLFLDHGWHDRGRAGDGAPPFDAYVLLVGPAPAFRPPDAVLLNVVSEAEVVGTIVQQRVAAAADSDRPRVRGIELPGAPHGFAHGRIPASDDHRHTDRPYAPIVTAALAGLDRWVRDGVPMPHAPRIGRDPDALDGIARDEHANAVGGVPVPWLDAPTSQLLPRCACSPTLGEEIPFTAERLAALYGSDSHRPYRKPFRGAIGPHSNGQSLAHSDVKHQPQRPR